MKNEESSESSTFESEIEVLRRRVSPNSRMFSGWNRTSRQIAQKQESSTGSSKFDAVGILKWLRLPAAANSSGRMPLPLRLALYSDCGQRHR
jgi:hypothetical protein